MAVEKTLGHMRATDDLNGTTWLHIDFARHEGETDHDYLHRLLLVRMVHTSIGLPAKTLSVEIAHVMERMGMRLTLGRAEEPCLVRR